MQAGLFVYNAKQKRGEERGEGGTRVCPLEASRIHNATYKVGKKEREREREACIYTLFWCV
jgi:polyferredoxin